MKPVLPPASLGILGSGQLGRMFTMRAVEAGYTVYCYSPEKNSPASKAGAIEFVGDYEDEVYLDSFLQKIDALTFEFENIPVKTLLQVELVANKKIVSPSPKSIGISQNRMLEKDFFKKIGLPTVKYISISKENDIAKIRNTVGFPCILKTVKFGYDGKGQRKVHNEKGALEFYSHIREELIAEELFQFEKEISVVAARFQNGKIFSYDPSENLHTKHILDLSLNPARISASTTKKAIAYTERLLNKLNYTGVLALEFFLKKDTLVCNEFAPRPHNSGHFSIDASTLSQFDLQLRSLCNLDFDGKIQSKPCLMKNILGDNFEAEKKKIPKLMKSPDYHLHLYQKDEPRTGRKMGHWNYTGKIPKTKLNDLFNKAPKA